MRKALFSLSIICVVMLSGCGDSNHAGSNQTGATVPIKTLPSAVQANLSPLSKRQRIVRNLPLKKGGESQNILFINPGEQYAIQQFKIAWPQISNKPTVVWVGTTRDNANLIWSKEGYPSNPLPSSKTIYTVDNTPTPDAYHIKTSGTWVEIPGILNSNESNEWIDFFK